MGIQIIDSEYGDSRDGHRSIIRGPVIQVHLVTSPGQRAKAQIAMVTRSRRQHPRDIAPRVLATHHAQGDAGLTLSEAINALRDHAAEAQRTRNGRELALFEAHPERIGRLVDRLIEGNYRDTAATLAGITARSIRGWMDAAEKGDPRYERSRRSFASPRRWPSQPQ